MEFVKAGAAFSNTTSKQILEAWIAERHAKMTSTNAPEETPAESAKETQTTTRGSTLFGVVGESAQSGPWEDRWNKLQASQAKWMDGTLVFWFESRISNDEISTKQYRILEHRFHAVLESYQDVIARVDSLLSKKIPLDEKVVHLLLDAISETHGKLLEVLATYKGEKLNHNDSGAFIDRYAKYVNRLESEISSVFEDAAKKSMWTDGKVEPGQGQIEMARSYRRLGEMLGTGGHSTKVFRIVRSAETPEDCIAAIDHVLAYAKQNPTEALCEMVLVLISVLNKRMIESGKLKGKAAEKYANLMGMVREAVGETRYHIDEYDELKVDFKRDRHERGPLSKTPEGPERDKRRAMLHRLNLASARLSRAGTRLNQSISNLQHLVLAMQHNDISQDTALKDIPEIINENKLGEGKVTKNALSTLYSNYGKIPKEIDEFLRWDVEIPVLTKSTIEMTTDSPVAKRKGEEVWSHVEPAFLFEYTPGGPAQTGHAQSGSVALNPVWNKLDPEYLETRHCYHSLKALAQFWYAGNITVKEAGYLCIPPTQVDPLDRDQKYLLDYVRLDVIVFHGGTDEHKKKRAYELMKMIARECKSNGMIPPLFFPAKPDPVWEQISGTENFEIPEHRYLRIIWHPDTIVGPIAKFDKVMGKDDVYREAPIYHLIGEDCPNRPAGWPNPVEVAEWEHAQAVSVDEAINRARGK
jgi:hypothetical protein